MSTKETTFIRKYWKQIDLHSHTLRGVSCDGKSDSANYSHKTFLKNLKEFGTQLQAVTNHNTLHLEDHIKHAIICNLVGISYIPGVEIDVKLKDGSKPFHCVFLLGPNNDICSFSKKLNEKTLEKQLIHSVYYDEEELSDIFTNMHFIYVVHAVKPKGLAESEDTIELDKDNINWVCQAIKNALAEPILFENTRPKYVHSFANRFREFSNREDIIRIASQQVTTSDYKFDGDKTRHDSWIAREKYAICSEPTFEGLELSIRHYKSRFQLVSQIVEPPTFIEKIVFSNIDNQRLKINGEIECSPYFNVIIGNSGSGKTLLLNEIYRSVNNNSANLNAVITKETKLKDESESVYGEYIGKNTKILQTSFYKNIKPVAVEIDKIYKKMLDANNPTEIASLFNVGLPTSANLIIQKYQTEIVKSENLLSEINNYCKQGTESFSSIKSNIAFIGNNDTGSNSFVLSREVFDDTILDSLNKSYSHINALIEDKDKIDDWIKAIFKFLPEKTDDINELNKRIDNLVQLLKIKRKNLDIKIKIQKMNKRFVDIYNLSADSVNKIIGNKQVVVDKARSTIKEQTNRLRECVKSILTNEFLFSSLNLSYPFEEIERNILENQNNEYARISVNYKEEDKVFDSVKPESQHIISINSNLTKIRSLFKQDKELRFDNSNDVKTIVQKLKKENINLSRLLNTSIPFAIELYDNNTWKNAQNINPGNLAKNYMTYYFKNVLDTKRPNVVFIDQPENDVDKSFISTVLANFISNNKNGVQFFITSHEPILGVNADSNYIIEAFRYNDGPIGYSGKSFESRSSNNQESGKDVASRILDGGKENVIQRNQIYGGSIDD